MDYKNWPYQDKMFEQRIRTCVKESNSVGATGVAYDMLFIASLLSMCKLCLDEQTTNDSGMPISRDAKDALLKVASTSLATWGVWLEKADSATKYEHYQYGKIEEMFCKAATALNESGQL